MFEFYNLNEKRVSFGFYANTEELYKGKYKKEGGKNFICDFDSRKFDFDDQVIYDSRGNQISDTVGTFADKNGNKVDLLTG